MSMSFLGTDPARRKESKNNKKDTAVDPTQEMPPIADPDTPKNPEPDSPEEPQLTQGVVDEVKARLAADEKQKEGAANSAPDSPSASKSAEPDPSMISAMAAGSAQEVRKQQQQQQQAAEPQRPLQSPGPLIGFDEVVKTLADQDCFDRLEALMYGATKAVLEDYNAEKEKAKWVVVIKIMSPDGKKKWTDFVAELKAKAKVDDGEKYIKVPGRKAFLPIDEVLPLYAAEAKIAYFKKYKVGNRTERDDSLALTDPRVAAEGERMKAEFFASQGITI